MQTSNPFELILNRLDQLQSTINDLSIQQQETQTTSEADPNRLLNLTEAAEILRKPVGTTRYYIHSRNLPATKIGKSFLIKYADLLKWINDFQDKGKANDPLSSMLANRKRYRKP